MEVDSAVFTGVTSHDKPLIFYMYTFNDIFDRYI